MEGIEPRTADSVVTWSAYILALDDICSNAGIPVPLGAEIDAELSDRSALRITVKAIT